MTVTGQVLATHTKRGRYKAGQSGNPRGMPKLDSERLKDVRELARAYTIEAMETLRNIMLDNTEKGSNRITAASIILERGWGRVAPSIDINLPQPDKVDLLTTEQLNQMLLEAKADDT